MQKNINLFLLYTHYAANTFACINSICVCVCSDVLKWEENSKQPSIMEANVW